MKIKPGKQQESQKYCADLEEKESKKKKKTHINGSRDYKFTMHKMVLKHFFFKTIEEKRVCKTNNQMMRETHS